MKIKTNYSYIKNLIMILLLFVDSLFLIIFKSNIIPVSIYLIANFIILSIIGAKSYSGENMILSIFFMLFYSYFIEIYIHYLNLDVFLEAEYLFLIPLVFAFFKNKKRNYSFMVCGLLLIFINFIIAILGGKVNILFYIKAIVPILTFLLLYSSLRQLKFDYIGLFKFLFIASIILTIIQTFLGFNRDTRNGIFGVFGLNAYSFLIMCYPVYNLCLWLKKKTSIWNLLFSLGVAIAIFLCTENKASIVLLFISMILLIIIDKGISLKKIIILVVILLTICISYKLLIKFYPFFSYLNNLDTIYNYFFLNNNWLYKYSRFESLNIVFRDVELADKIFGIGFGASTPLDTIFYNELERVNYAPYYIGLYGSNHGFHLTSLSTIILDGGLVYMGIIIMFLGRELLITFKKMRLKLTKDKSIYFIKIAAIIFSIFYISYGNVFTNFRTTAIIAFLLGFIYLENIREEEER